jgi:hypothetical protein
MFGTQFFSSRSQKEGLLTEIIQKLSISESEKELYILSIGILDEWDFDIFYENITSQFRWKNNPEHASIEPLTAILI